MNTPDTPQLLEPDIRAAQFVIEEANKTLATLVAYEGQYERTAPKAIQERILRLADFITDRLAAISYAAFAKAGNPAAQ